MPDKTGLLRFALYAATGAVGTTAHYAILLTTVSTGWLAPVSASMCGAAVGAWINFLLNARLTFRTRASWSIAWRFAATALLAAAGNGMAMAALTGWFQMAYLFAQTLVTVGLLALTFLINSLWTFRSDTK
jgi:putative flippase GtrA